MFMTYASLYFRQFMGKLTRINFFFIFTFLLIVSFVTSCSQLTTVKQEKNLNFEDNQMRHGLTIFTGPTRTVVGVKDEGSIRRGQSLFKRNCQECHGSQGKGYSPLATKLGIKPANLKSISKTLPNHYLVIQINEGKSEMPRWKDLLTARQVSDLTNYIQAIGER